MKLFNVWKKMGGVNEKCLMDTNGDYVGINTGTLYLKNEGHYHSKQHIGVIKGIDKIDNTGMIHLDNGGEGLTDKQKKLEKFIGCYVTLESAHYFGYVEVFRCLELNDYVSSNEVDILTDSEIRRLMLEGVLDKIKEKK